MYTNVCTNTLGQLLQTKVVKLCKRHPNAEQITQESLTCADYSLTVVGRDGNRVEDVYGDVNVFTTGVSLDVPINFHAEIIEHPQLYKAGYMLVGGPRIINFGDNSEILIPLYKFKETEDLELPFRAVTVVFRPTVYFSVIFDGVQEDEDSSEREEEKPKKKVISKGKTRTKKNHMF